MDKYSESFISSAYNYLYNMQYYAKDNKKVLNDLFDLELLLDCYNWCSYQEYVDSDLRKVEKVINDTILKNSELEFVNIVANKYYKNVNTPQTIWTWQRVYDHIFSGSDTTVISLGEDGFVLLDEDNNILIGEN